MRPAPSQVTACGGSHEESAGAGRIVLFVVLCIANVIVISFDVWLANFGQIK